MRLRTLHGAVVGALLTAPLIAVSYLGWKLLGLPFAPFDVFDWIARALPGPIVTFGIDAMVRLVRAMPVGSTAAVAKTAEQAMAIAMVELGGAAAGAALFATLGLSGEPGLLFGVIFGGVLGGSTVAIEDSMNRIPTGSFLDPASIVFTCLVWGVAFGWAYDRLQRGGDGAPDTGAPTAPRPDRRRFLVRLGGVTAAVTFVSTAWGVLIKSARSLAQGERWSATHALPNARSPVTPAPGTRAEFTALEDHYRVDTTTRAPVIDVRSWRLRVGGLVEKPLALTLEELRRMPPLAQFITLACVSNLVGGDLIGTTRWTGVSLQELLPRLRLTPAASHLKITSADGFYEVVALDLIASDPRVMLAFAWDGVPLAVEHGFPLRIYIPNVYGMKQPKWIQSIDAIERWEPGYWVSRGWDRDGAMKITSVVDTVAVSATSTDGSGHALVPIGGVAHAGARGISKVEVRVDEGEWREARLRDPLSETSWVVWRLDLPLERGEHVVTVRCYDGAGMPQVAGFHSKRVRGPV
jgi:DMSO/TMAO reductase YedYZ molybdopterin-dependent catalytic subunit